MTALVGMEVTPAPDAAGLTAAWLSTALGSHANGLSTEPVGTGQMADTLRLSPQWGEPGMLPSTLIAKVASTDPTSRSTAALMRSYEIEVNFYRTIAPLISSRLPGCHYAAYDGASGAFTVVLDSVAPGTVGDDVAGCDEVVAEAALRELAGLHAPCWERADLAQLEWLNRGPSGVDEFTGGLVASLIPGFLERYAGVLTPEHAGVCERFIPHVVAWFLDYRGPMTAVHQDFRLDNMLFPADGGRPFILDWQTLMWGNAAADVAYFLGGSVPVEVRQQHGDRLMRVYHDALVAGGVEGYDFEALRADVRRRAYGGLSMAIGASMMVGRTDRGDVMFTTAASRYAQQIIDLDSESTLP